MGSALASHFEVYEKPGKEARLRYNARLISGFVL